MSFLYTNFLRINYGLLQTLWVMATANNPTKVYKGHLICAMQKNKLPTCLTYTVQVKLLFSSVP